MVDGRDVRDESTEMLTARQKKSTHRIDRTCRKQSLLCTAPLPVGEDYSTKCRVLINSIQIPSELTHVLMDPLTCSVTKILYCMTVHENRTGTSV